nr:M48 family metallopeptidase [Kibdelosporangium sp. MJ126-NF4]CTQ95282.1 peptidase M48, Ste24p [Kibdelosporangium sp. MJ126-NF4]
MLVTQLDDCCPQCDTRLAQRLTQPPWCGACEWNLSTYEPDADIPGGRRRLVAFSHRMGYRLDAALFAASVGKQAARPGWNRGRVLLVAVSAVLLALVLACAGYGVRLVIDDFPSFGILPGALLLLVAWGLRPRLGRYRDEWGTIDAAKAPRLHALVAEVAAAAGTPVPDRIVVDSTYNASAGQTGLRRRRTLRLGLTLWCSLTPQERVALLGHELGHFVNNDPARRLATQPALTVFGTLAHALQPHPDIDGYGLLHKLTYQIVKPVLWLLSRILVTIHVSLLSVSMRDSHRAEYRADFVGSQVSGTAAMVSLQDAMLLAESTIDALRSAVRSPTPDARPWHEIAAAVRADHADTLSLLRQFSVREDASLFASHPPSGYRARMIEALPAQDPSVVLSAEDADTIDAELAEWYRRARRDIAN